jgi:hypothetical protein
MIRYKNKDGKESLLDGYLASGLDDINGHELYEGDKISVALPSHETITGEVYFSDGKFWMTNEDHYDLEFIVSHFKTRKL